MHIHEHRQIALVNATMASGVFHFGKDDRDGVFAGENISERPVLGASFSGTRVRGEYLRIDEKRILAVEQRDDVAGSISIRVSRKEHDQVGPFIHRHIKSHLGSGAGPEISAVHAIEIGGVGDADLPGRPIRGLYGLGHRIVRIESHCAGRTKSQSEDQAEDDDMFDLEVNVDFALHVVSPCDAGCGPGRAAPGVSATLPLLAGG
jgi:hypothetical protein